MKKMIRIAGAAALVAVSASASAWWDSPMSIFADEFFGDGDTAGNGDFNMAMSLSANSQAFTRGYGYNRYYHVPYYYGYPAAPEAVAAPVADAE